MTEKREIFVLEFITGGGLYNAALPDSLAREGELMLDALLSDLRVIPGVAVTTTRDERLPPLDGVMRAARVDNNPWPVWQACIDQADLVWLIAPESQGVLARLSAMVPPHKNLGCLPASIAITASKSATAACLSARGIAVVPALRPVADDPAPLLCKPDDGAGCSDTRVFEEPLPALAWLADHPDHIAQPFLPGEPASLSMLCREERAWLLSCNRQLIARDAQGFLHYRGSVLNGMAAHWDVFAHLAGQIACAVPGLAGYIGVDVMVHDGQLTVLEINPRLTTSYIGLRAAIGLNPAELVLELHYNRLRDGCTLKRNRVEVRI